MEQGHVYSREVEKKYIVGGVLGNIPDLAAVIRRNLSVVGEVPLQESRDFFWEVPNADFLRLRENSRELTVKVTDKGDIVDRIEENVLVDWDSMVAARKLATLLFGEPSAVLTKRFIVFHVNLYNQISYKHHTPAIVCLYEVLEDPKYRIFLEVEAHDVNTVDRTVADLSTALVLTQEMSSLYQIFKGAK